MKRGRHKWGRGGVRGSRRNLAGSPSLNILTAATSTCFFGNFMNEFNDGDGSGMTQL